MFFHVGAQQSVHLGLVSTSLLSVPFNHVTIKAECELLFGNRLESAPNNAFCEHLRRDFGNVRKVNASSRLKSVPDFFEIDCFFIFCRLSRRDNPNHIIFVCKPRPPRFLEISEVFCILLRLLGRDCFLFHSLLCNRLRLC